jgi:hypothetical protein
MGVMTVRVSAAGVTNLRCDFAMNFVPTMVTAVRMMVDFRTVTFAKLRGPPPMDPIPHHGQAGAFACAKRCVKNI